MPALRHVKGDDCSMAMPARDAVMANSGRFRSPPSRASSRSTRKSNSWARSGSVVDWQAEFAEELQVSRIFRPWPAPLLIICVWRTRLPQAIFLEPLMATLTIPDLDEDLDRALQAAAVRQGVSKEEFARLGLLRIVTDATRAELDQSSGTGAELLQRIRSRFAHGYAVDLDLPSRQSSSRSTGLSEG